MITIKQALAESKNANYGLQTSELVLGCTNRLETPQLLVEEGTN